MTISILQSSVKLINITIGSMLSIIIICKRIDQVLQKQTIKNNHNIITNDHDDTVATIIKIENAIFKWPINEERENKEEDFFLKNISIKIKTGKLIAIIGSVGAGKTSLFEAILGEMECVEGNIIINIKGK
eukprot:364902_1